MTAEPQGQIRVNQVGYLTDGPKQATLACDAAEPCAWRLADASGAVLAEGSTVPRGLDETAGEAVHTIDFGSVRATGQGLRLTTSCGAVSPAFAVGGRLYDTLLLDALRVFTLQRSGAEITADVAGPQYARAAGHVAADGDLGDGALRPLPAGVATTADGVDLYDGWTGDYTLDARGGWYDAGDMGTYVVNGGIAVAQLLGLVERARRAGRPDDDAVALALDEARWELDWMARMQVADGLPLAGMVHHKVHDESWTPIPTLPAEDPRRRFVHRPSTSATLNFAAVAAQGARVLEPGAFTERLLAAARTAYRAAAELPVLLAPDTNVLENFGGGPYDDVDIDDERYWAAAELYLTTGEERFLADLRANPYHLGGTKTPFVAVGFDWRDTAAWVRMQLATVASALPERDALRAELVAAADALLATAEPFGQLYSPPDRRYAWGSNGMVANNAAIVAAAHEVSGQARHRDGALAGLDYLLGRNALGVSYVTGYGSTDVRHQHSRWFARSADPATPPPPPGTLSGGPNSDCPDPVSAALAGSPAQRCFVDHIEAFGVNEMTVNWNSALAWMVAYAVAQ